MTAPPLPTLADIEQAREVLSGVAINTPMEESRWLSALAGGPVSLKCENLQRTGSFKSRGAYVRIARLSAEERANGVVAASDCCEPFSRKTFRRMGLNGRGSGSRKRRIRPLPRWRTRSLRMNAYLLEYLPIVVFLGIAIGVAGLAGGLLLAYLLEQTSQQPEVAAESPVVSE